MSASAGGVINAGKRRNKHSQEESLMERHYRLLGRLNTGQPVRRLDFSATTPNTVTGQGSSSCNTGSTVSNGGSSSTSFYGNKSRYYVFQLIY